LARRTANHQTRCPEAGRDIVCPHCKNVMRIYAFPRGAMTCSDCGIPSTKTDWILPQTCDKCAHVPTAERVCSVPGCNKTYRRCDNHGDIEGVMRSLHSHKALYHG
jgi:hypothetical protein